MNELDDTRFAVAMENCRVATRSEVDDRDYEVFRKAFSKWTIEEFEESMEDCWKLSRFPNVGQVRASFPRRPSLHDQEYEKDYNQHKHSSVVGLLTAQQESEEDKGPDDIESAIDEMTDEDLIEFVFAPMSDLLGKENRIKAGRFGVKCFRANPNGKLYRGVIRTFVKSKMAKSFQF